MKANVERHAALAERPWFAQRSVLWSLALLCAVLGTVIVALAVRHEPATGGASRPPAVAREASQPLIESRTAVTEEAVPSSVAARCPDQLLSLTAHAKPEIACFSTTRIAQNGSVRTYQVDTTAGPQRSLRVDASGSLVLKATLTQGAATFRCDGADCKGISLGRRDAEGVRALSFTRTELTGADQKLTIAGQLRIAPDALVPALACSDQGISIITSDGSSTTFCPKGGAGFELDNAGNHTYRFTSLDNESVLVVVDQSQHLRRIEYQGDAVLACEGAGCTRARIAAPNAAGERVFTFTGTTLLDARSQATNAVLNGTLVVPRL